MSELGVVAINTPIGIVCSRTAFWLGGFVYNASDKSLEFSARFSKSMRADDGGAYKKDFPFSVAFKGVGRFECIDYDSMEREFGGISKSNFDQLIGGRDVGSRNVYLLWFYDECFRVEADGYSMAGFGE
ncbi:hypothetical protein [Burkholderia sp. F1]|uniref:hypothetical protein n=1 Tax=Burkholderia sp. F1 TaxID=3366817 RepID=UPI003D70B970